MRQATCLFGNGARFRSSCFLSLLAFGADAEDAVAVMEWLEVVAAGYLVLQFFNLLAVKLNQRSACGADQMIVMRMLVFVFIQRAAIMKFEFASETTLLKELERAIHRSEPYRGVLRFDDRVKILARNVTFGVEKDVEYQIALTRSL